MAVLPVLLVALALLLAPAASEVVRSDNSPVCNTYLPTCAQKCRQGQDYIYVCSAGNGPQGGPYVLCQCVAPAMPVGQPLQEAKLVLANWPGAKACNDKTWINDCTSQMNVKVNGTQVTFTPAVSSAFNEQCDPAQGYVIGPKGQQAAVTFPQYPIALTSTGPDGTLTIDFSATASDDPNNMDWSQCIVTYKIVQGQFLNPIGGMMAQRGGTLQQQLALQQQQQAAQNAAAGAAPLRLAQLLAAALACLVLLLRL